MLVFAVVSLMHRRNHVLAICSSRSILLGNAGGVPLENFHQNATYRIAHLCRGRFAAEIATPNLQPANVLAVEDLFDRGLDRRGFGVQAERVPQHHCRAEDLRRRVDDPLAGNVWRGPVHRLVDTVTSRPAVGDPAEARAGEDAQGADHAARLVRKHVSERVVGVDDAVEHARVLNHEHAQAICELVLELDVRELLGEDVAGDAPPQAPGGEHVGLVAGPDDGGPAVALAVAAHCRRERRGHAGTPLNLLSPVRPRVAGHVCFFDLGSKVRAAAVLAEHDEVGAFGDGPFQRRLVDKAARVECAGANVGKGVEVLTESKEAGFGVRWFRAPISRRRFFS